MARKPFDKNSNKKSDTDRKSSKPFGGKSSDRSDKSSFKTRKPNSSTGRKSSGSTFDEGSSKRSFSKDKDFTDKKRPVGATEKKYFKRPSAESGSNKDREGGKSFKERESSKRPFEKKEDNSFKQKKYGTSPGSTYRGKSADFNKRPNEDGARSGEYKKTPFERKGTFRSTNNDDFDRKPNPGKPEEFKRTNRYSEEEDNKTSFNKLADSKPYHKKSTRDYSKDISFDKAKNENFSAREPRKTSRSSSENEKTPYKKPFVKPDRIERTAGDYKKSPTRGAKPAKSSSFKNNNADNKPDFEIPKYDLSKIKKKKSEEPTSDGKIRLNKYIANAGVCSRREADQIIIDGLIKVNGKVVTEMGYQVSSGDSVKYGSKVLNPEKQVYILLNKPKDFITTTDDPEDRKTVMHLVANACKERVYPVGRLDRNTTGLLLLTNDGELAKKLTHPSHEIKKVYQAELDKPVTKEDMEKLAEGVELEDGPVHIHDLALIDKNIVGLEIHEGRNRIVRRLFEHLGYEVIYLDRVVYAGLTKKDLQRGHWRFLTEKEVIKLKFFL